MNAFMFSRGLLELTSKPIYDDLLKVSIEWESAYKLNKEPNNLIHILSKTLESDMKLLFVVVTDSSNLIIKKRWLCKSKLEEKNQVSTFAFGCASRALS